MRCGPVHKTLQRIIRLLVLAGAAITWTAVASEISEDYKALVESRFNSQEKWMKEAITSQEEKARVALQAAERAIEKSERAANERFASVNEFRGQLKDQTATFISRQEALAYLVAVLGLVTWIQRRQQK